MHERFRSPEWRRLDQELRDMERLLRRAENDARDQRATAEKLREACSMWRSDAYQWRHFAQDITADMNGDLAAVWSKHHKVSSKL